MMSICPNGHQSAADDWCEVCGHRMSAQPPSPPATTGYDPDATAASEPCPACGTPREGAALFCEECRYNYQTRSSTTYIPPAPPTGPFPSAADPFPSAAAGPFQPYERYEQYEQYERSESQGSRPSQMNRPAEPLSPGAVVTGSGDFLLPPPVAPAGTAEPMFSSVPEAFPPAAWTAVVAADREYYDAMMARSGPDAAGLAFPEYAFELQLQLPPGGNQLSIGRRRHSTGEAPDIDLSQAPEDPGVSHKHAVLVQQPDGSWSVVDQESTNGTTVNGGEDPIQPYVPVPLKDGDRVHVGAWTTITVRRG